MYIWHMNDTSQPILIFYFPGAKLQTLAKEASKYVTVRDRLTGVTTYEWQSEIALVNLLLGRVSQAEKFLHKKHPATKVIFCALAGAQLDLVVPSPCNLDQVNLNNAIWSFNVELVKKYENSESFHPRLDRPVHRTSRGARKDYYHHLRDGLHPNELTLYHWAKEIIKTVQQN